MNEYKLDDFVVADDQAIEYYSSDHPDASLDVEGLARKKPRLSGAS